MFGKRPGTAATPGADPVRPGPAAPPPGPEPRGESGHPRPRRSRAAAAGCPLLDEYYATKSMIFGALIEAIDLAQLSPPRSGPRGNPRHRQRDHRAEERRDVDRRAGGTPRRHLQRRARLRAARTAPRPRRHRRHHGERRRADLHRGRRQDPAHGSSVPRQPAAHEHLPADREPGRPPGRRILADLRRAPAGRIARQRDRAAARHRRARRSPSASSRRTS